MGMMGIKSAFIDAVKLLLFYFSCIVMWLIVWVKRFHRSEVFGASHISRMSKCQIYLMEKFNICKIHLVADLSWAFPSSRLMTAGRGSKPPRDPEHMFVEDERKRPPLSYLLVSFSLKLRRG